MHAHEYKKGHVYPRDVRNAGVWYCVPGMKVFFSRLNMTVQDFTRNGISFEALESTKDKMALAAIEQAKIRESAGE